MNASPDPLGRNISDAADFLSNSPMMRQAAALHRFAEETQRQQAAMDASFEEAIQEKWERDERRDAAILATPQQLEAMQQLIGMLVQRTEQQAEDAKRQHRVNIILGFVASTSGAATLFALNAPWKAWIAVMIGAAIVAIVWVLSSRPSTDQNG